MPQPSTHRTKNLPYQQSIDDIGTREFGILRLAARTLLPFRPFGQGFFAQRPPID
jgi:hypothetical protein